MPKPSRSPLYFYAREYQQHYQNTNHQRITITQAIEACYDDWKALSDEQKQPYKNLYEDWRLQYRENPQLNNIPNQHIKNKQEIKINKTLCERDIPCEELKVHYDRFNIERDFLTSKYLPLDISELLAMPIYIINFQIFCKVDEEDGGEVLPAEMCILRYTLSEGVTIYRQKFIKPQKIPSGYMSACLEHSKETHEIPLNNFTEATDNYKLIYEQLKTFLFPTIINKCNNMSNNDDRTCRRYLRLIQPCVFYPSFEYEQTSKLIDWLQEMAEGIKPTKDTRLVNLASIESLIMVLAGLKNQRVSRDDIHRTFENATYSYMIQERCPYHFQLGISHCSVARCHAAAKLISAYLHRLYVPERSSSASIISEKNSFMKTSIESINNMSNKIQQPMKNRSIIEPSKIISSQYSSTDTSDSIASSYRRPEHQTQYDFSRSNEQITNLQKQNFHRLLSNAESLTSNNNNHLSEYSIEDNNFITDKYSNNQRNILNQRKQILLKALQSIDQQIEELDIQ